MVLAKLNCRYLAIVIGNGGARADREEVLRGGRGTPDCYERIVDAMVPEICTKYGP